MKSSSPDRSWRSCSTPGENGPIPKSSWAQIYGLPLYTATATPRLFLALARSSWRHLPFWTTCLDLLSILFLSLPDLTQYSPRPAPLQFYASSSLSFHLKAYKATKTTNQATFCLNFLQYRFLTFFSKAPSLCLIYTELSRGWHFHPWIFKVPNESNTLRSLEDMEYIL